MAADAAPPIRKCQLKSGEELDIYLFRPGRSIPPIDVEQIRDFIVQPREPWFDAAGREEVERGLGGTLRESSRDHYFLGLIGPHLVGATWYQISRRTPEIGALGYVYTDPGHRGLGVGSFLNRVAVDHFRGEGGVGLYLGTVNPIARRVYERCGFSTYNGIVMRYVAPPWKQEEFDAAFFGHSGVAQVRSVEWGDAGMIDALYASPYPSLIRDYRRRSFSHPAVPQRSCHIFPSLMVDVEQQNGAFLALETPQSRLVGAALLARNDPRVEGHVGVVDFVVQPAYMAQAAELLSALMRDAHVRGCGTLRACFASCDVEKKDVAKAVGFLPEGTMSRQLRVGDTWWDLEIFTAQLDEVAL